MVESGVGNAINMVESGVGNAINITL